MEFFVEHPEVPFAFAITPASRQGGYAVIAAIFPRVAGLILSSQRNAPEVTLWVYNRKRNAHRRILNFQGGGISWDRTNDLYDVNVALWPAEL